MSVGIRAEIFRSLLGDISAALYVYRLVGTILYGAKLHNYLECKVIRMDFFELLTHRFFLTEEQEDIFFTRKGRKAICSFVLMSKYNGYFIIAIR